MHFTLNIWRKQQQQPKIYHTLHFIHMHFDSHHRHRQDSEKRLSTRLAAQQNGHKTLISAWHCVGEPLSLLSAATDRRTHSFDDDSDRLIVIRLAMHNNL